MTLPETDQARLAQIRSDNLQWRATDSHAEYWETTFLLKIIDQISKEKKQ